MILLAITSYHQNQLPSHTTIFATPCQLPLPTITNNHPSSDPTAQYQLASSVITNIRGFKTRHHASPARFTSLTFDAYVYHSRDLLFALASLTLNKFQTSTLLFQLLLGHLLETPGQPAVIT